MDEPQQPPPRRVRCKTYIKNLVTGQVLFVPANGILPEWTACRLAKKHEWFEYHGLNQAAKLNREYRQTLKARRMREQMAAEAEAEAEMDAEIETGIPQKGEEQ